VRICFDNDDAGVTGSQVQVGRVVDVAAAVRNVCLPAGTKDLRDWINAGHSYAEIWEYSGTFPPIEPADRSEQLTPHQALLENVGLVVCGQLDGTESVEVYSRNLHKTTLFRDLNRLSLETAVLAAGAAVEEHVAEGAHEASPGKVTIKALRRAIAKEGGRRLLTSRQPLGCGIWRVGESVVLVGPRQADVFTPSGDLEPIDLPAVGDQRLNFNGEPWYDRAELKRNLQHAQKVEWCIEVFLEVQSLFAKWDNWSEESTPQLIAGLVGATWIQTLWPFRPLVAVLGPTNCGKTLLLEETLPPMFGGLGFFCQKPTEAGLRQNIGDMSKAVFIDEFEKCQHREKILELLRTTSRGGQIPRGSTHGKGMLFGLRHIVWTGAIELNLPHAADKNRFILFHLKAIPKGPAKLFPPRAADMRNLGQRLLAAVLCRHRAILEKGDLIRRLDIEVFQRVLELYAVPLAVIAGVSDMGMADIASLARHTLGHQHGDDEDSDEAEILQAILESYVPLPRGQRHTVSQLLDGSCGQLEGEDGLLLSRGAALEAAGVRIIRFSDDDDVLFLAKGPICRHLLTGTEHRNTDISQTLARIDGAKRGTQRLGGRTARGVSIPSEALKALVGLEISALTLF